VGAIADSQSCFRDVAGIVDFLVAMMQEEHPQTMMDIMRFYEKNTRGDSDDEVWHKFDNAQARSPVVIAAILWEAQ
jgi:hypothetical protein